MPRRYWLVKSDPETFSWEDLKKSPKKTTCWDGVRNYQARNTLRDEMSVGDGVLFYHSQSDPPAVVGIAKVVRAGYPDPTQFRPGSDPAHPQWYAVDLKADRDLKRPVRLDEMRQARGLENMVLLTKGSRLSVQPVTPKEWKTVLSLGGIRE